MGSWINNIMGWFGAPTPENAADVIAQQQAANQGTAQFNQGLLNNAAAASFGYQQQAAPINYGYGVATQGQNIGANSYGKSGPFSYSSIYTDPTTGQRSVVNGLDPSLNAGALSGNVGSTLGLLPGSGIDFSAAGAMPGQIAQAGINNLYANTSPLLAQQMNTAITDMTNRGLPVGSDAWNTNLGNIVRSQDAGMSSGVAGIYNAVPQNTQALTNTALTQGMAPYTQAGAAMGLLGNMNNIGAPWQGVAAQSFMNAPTVNAPNVGAATQANTDVGSIYNQAYNQQEGQFKDFWSGVGALGNAAMGAFSPMGLFSNTSWNPFGAGVSYGNGPAGGVGNGAITGGGAQYGPAVPH